MKDCPEILSMDVLSSAERVLWGECKHSRETSSYGKCMNKHIWPFGNPTQGSARPKRGENCARTASPRSREVEVYPVEAAHVVGLKHVSPRANTVIYRLKHCVQLMQPVFNRPDVGIPNVTAALGWEGEELSPTLSPQITLDY